MKTILYQPLFINPQAYFVFPQLYHIEKGDSYIEPANITGQLIINDLTKVLTSTPTLNVVQDTNQVDFGLFKGKHIRISQYTNIGAVVLGEWYIPGTPEPEQPDWFKESIVAWYSPYCKQGMTNFDVIESYADDFTKWRIENTGVTSTQKKIVIAAGTELKYNVTYKGFGNSIAEFDKNIVYQTKKSYNGRKSLIHGPVSITDYDELYLGKLRSNENNMFIGCHGDIILFNRSLTEYEISWVKNNMMCSKQQEPDIDL